MTDTITVVTVVHSAYLGSYLAEAYASLVAQVLPAGWQWEWQLRGNGVSADAVGAFTSDPRTTFGSDPPMPTPSISRNVAIGHASSDLLRLLDADDTLLPEALARDIAVLDTDPVIGWTTSAANDLMPDGSTHTGDRPTHEAGRLSRGWVADYLRSHSWQAPFLPGTLCIRRDLAARANGWADFEGTDDMALIVAASELAEGYYNPTPSINYRRHRNQLSIAEMNAAAEARELGRRFIDARAHALREGGY